MGAGPHGGAHPLRDATGREYSSPQWSDNVGRMHLFMERHPEVGITVPRRNGTDDFIATWAHGELKDRSLGWLMDKLEAKFGDARR